jgi:uncharacterized protein (TIGR02147 family)
MERSPVSVFGYMDFRQFLRDCYEKLRGQDRKFSHRFIARKLGMASSGWFGDLLKARTNLSGSHLVKLADLLNLKANESGYLEALVHYNQASSLAEKKHHFHRLLSFKETKVDLVGEEKFAYYSNWYCSAIRELLFFYDFTGDFAALGRKLDPHIKATQAQEAVRLLLKLGFVRKDAQGRYRSQPATLKKDASFKSPHAVNFLLANMELGMQSLDKFEKEERHVSAMTLSYSQPAFQRAVSEIENLRKSLIALMENDPDPDKVFQFNLQFFPITR